MIIAERMHTALVGLSSSVCTILAGYLAKAEGIMTDLLETSAFHDRLLIPIRQFIDTGVTCATIRAVWNQRHKTSGQLNHG